MDNQILFSWDIHYVCNYRCPYCWFDEIWCDLAKQNKYLPIGKIIEAWEKIYINYGPARIAVLGGEPFIYPRFKELIRELSRMHFLEITSNLSVKLDYFMEEINPPRVSVTGTFHPLFADFDNFIKNVLPLKEKGTCHQIWYVAYPPQIKLMQYYKKKFDKYKIPVSVMTFWGNCHGIRYPQGYTKEEKDIIAPYLGERGGEEFQLKPKKTKGKLCRAGQAYAVIKAGGLAYRCSESCLEPIGNFFSNNFKLLKEPRPCESEFCPCNEWRFC